MRSRADHISGVVPTEIATFASGCFWGVEHIFLKHFPPKENKGILKTAVGYTGGKSSATDPDYRTVCSGTRLLHSDTKRLLNLVCVGVTEHAEALRIEFDPTIVTYDQLVGESIVYPCKTCH